MTQRRRRFTQPGLGRRVFQRGQARNALLLAGIQFAEEHGLMKLSMRGLQRRVGASTGTGFKAFDGNGHFACEMANVTGVAMTNAFLKFYKDGTTAGIAHAIAEWIPLVRANPSAGILPFAKPVLGGRQRVLWGDADQLSTTAFAIEKILRKIDPQADAPLINERCVLLLSLVIGFGALTANRSKVLGGVADPLASVQRAAKKLARSG